MKKITKITALTVAILTVIAAMGVICLAVFNIEIATRAFPFATMENPLPIIIAVYIGCADALAFLAELMLIMLSVKKGNPFVKRNVSALRRMALYCLIAMALVLFMGIMLQALSLYITAFILFFGSLCAFALSGVFDRAVDYKDENDLTV